MLLSNKEMEKELGVSTKTLFTLRKKGLPHIKLGRLVKYDKDEVMKWINEQK